MPFDVGAHLPDARRRIGAAELDEVDRDAIGAVEHDFRRVADAGRQTVLGGLGPEREALRAQARGGRVDVGVVEIEVREADLLRILALHDELPQRRGGQAACLEFHQQHAPHRRCTGGEHPAAGGGARRQPPEPLERRPRPAGLRAGVEPDHPGIEPRRGLKVADADDGDGERRTFRCDDVAHQITSQA